MTHTNRPAHSWVIAATAVLLSWLGIVPTQVRAQAGVKGYNVVASGSGTMLPTTTLASSSFIDASAYGTGDICAKINAVYSSTLPALPSEGAVIDARGIGSGTIQTCAASPWAGLTGGQMGPTVILLPSGTIQIPGTWVLPPRTRIKGMGVDGPAGTQIQAASGLTGYMIQLGSAMTFGDSVEDLALVGAATGQCSCGGILNEFSQEQTYVSHVNFSNFGGTALEIGGSGSGAQNSGPYSNLYITKETGACVQIIGGESRGIHSMTCSALSGLPPAGLLLDSSNNTVEDVHFEGFVDGIRVGSQGSATSNVIFNVSGTSTSTGAMTNVIHLSSLNTLADISIMGVRALANGSPAPNSIEDDVTGTTLSDASVGMYALGEGTAGGVFPGGHSRFTTSPSAPSLSSGNFGANAPTSNCAVGSLLSNATATNSATTLYLCVPSGGSGVWVAH